MKYRVSQLGGVAKRHNRGPSSRVGVHDRGGAVTAWCLPLLRQTCRSAQGHGQRANAPCQASMGEVEHTGFRACGVHPLSVLRSCSVQSQRMPGSSCSAACQDAHRAAPSCVTAPPSLFGGRPCSSWTWSAVSPNVRTGGRRPRCKGKLRLRGFVVCV